MVKKEKLYFRPLVISQWIRKYLPEQLYVTNLDWIFCPWDKKRLILFEEKHGKAGLTKGQKIIFPMINEALKIGCPKIGWKYDGFYRLNYDVDIKEENKGNVKTQESLLHEYSKALYNADNGLIEPINFRINNKTKSEEEIINFFKKFVL